MLTNQDKLDFINESIETTRTLKLQLMQIANNKKSPPRLVQLAKEGIERERLYEQQLLDERGEAQETVRLGGDSGLGELNQSDAPEIQNSRMV